jgi:hypothetical protein
MRVSSFLLRGRSAWFLLFLVGLTVSVVIGAPRRTSISRLQAADTEHLSVNNGRPLAEAAWELEKRYGWVITYEDPMYVNESEINDVTLQVRRDLDKYKPGQAPTVLVPKGGPLAITFNLTSDDNIPVRPESVVQKLLEANGAAGNGGSFRLEVSGPIVHVIPTAYKNIAGTSIPLQPVLDSLISIPAEERTGMQSLEALCAAVSEVSQTKVVVGTVDPNLFVRYSNQLGAKDEKARDFLVSLLENVRGTARLDDTDLSWRLLFDPKDKTYALNIHGVRKPGQ